MTLEARAPPHGARPSAATGAVAEARRPTCEGGALKEAQVSERAALQARQYPWAIALVMGRSGAFLVLFL